MGHHWVIQDGLHREEGLVRLLDTLARFDVPHTLVKVVPFEHTLEPEPVIAPEQTVMVIGAYTMLKIAHARNWGPVFDRNLSYTVQTGLDAWSPSFFFNGDSKIVKVREVTDVWDGDGLRFIRPVEDGKAFNGKVYDWEEWHELLRKMDGLEEWHKYEIDVQIAVPKVIHAEYRLWVVDGKIVTASGYKRGSIVYPGGWGDIPPGLLTWAEIVIGLWTPDKAFCLDVFQTETHYTIGEINCIHAAGFYGADIQKLVAALDDLG